VNGLLRNIHLPGLSIPGNLILAPLAGYTDAAFRSICLEHGASLCYTEMVSAEGVARGNQKSFDLLRRSRGERILGVQIFGSSPSRVAQAVRAMAHLDLSLFDLNCGCSVPKVVKSGAGAALLRDPDRIRRLVEAMKGQTDVPVSVKLRSGWDGDSLNYLETGQAAVSGGASLVSLHARTRSQGFSGKADWTHIAALKRALDVPVLGSGDLFGPEDALRMLEQAGCDGVLFARGALGNPFVFAQTRALLSGESAVAAVSTAVRLQTALEHLRRTLSFKNEATACREMRKHFCHYTRGIPGGSELRKAVVSATRLREYEEIVKEYLDRSDGKGKGDSRAARQRPVDCSC
jgi:tRNA-dihydrouridine synthase B